MKTIPEVETSVTPSVGGKTRNAAIDHIRIVLTMLVILHHVAIACGGPEGWVLRGPTNVSRTVLLMFISVNQAFFMGFFFLLAGYYTPTSYERKGAMRFLGDRFLRLGVPLIIYFLVLSPFNIALARTGAGSALWQSWWEATRSGDFSPGPLWFAEALLLFAGGYVIWCKLRPAPLEVMELPSFGALALSALFLACVSFLVRLWTPVGTQVAWLQIGYFPCYIFLFAVGCAAGRSRLLERITLGEARP